MARSPKGSVEEAEAYRAKLLGRKWRPASVRREGPKDPSKHHKFQKLSRLYNLPAGFFLGLYEQQGRGCALRGIGNCGSNLLSDLVLDHDHRTGRPRGFLCHKHNTALGGFGDCASGVEQALAYLKESDNVQTSVRLFEYSSSEDASSRYALQLVNQPKPTETT